jgi:hypothetical protein
MGSLPREVLVVAASTRTTPTPHACCAVPVGRVGLTSGRHGKRCRFCDADGDGGPWPGGSEHPESNPTALADAACERGGLPGDATAAGCSVLRAADATNRMEPAEAAANTAAPAKAALDRHRRGSAICRAG